MNNRIISVKTRKPKSKPKNNIAEDHYFKDGNEVLHPFIMYSQMIDSYRNFHITDLQLTLELIYKYSFNQESITLPKYHPLVQYLPDASVEQPYKGSKEAIELIIILMDDHIGRTQLFKYSHVEMEFNEQFIKSLSDIAEFASMYEIQPVFDYIKNILTLTSSLTLYRPTLYKCLAAKSRSQEYMKNLLTKVFDRIEKKADIDSIYSKMFSRKKGCNSVYENIAYETEYGKNGLKGTMAIFHEFLINDIESVKIKPPKLLNLYDFLNMPNIKIISKFLYYFLNRKKVLYFDGKKIKPLPSDFDEYYKLKLPLQLNNLLKLNLLILSMNEYGRTPNGLYYNEDKMHITTF